MLILIIGGLVTWRLAHMIVKELGPRAIFARLRAYLAAHQRNSGGLFDLVSCISCTSIYIAALAAVVPACNALEWLWYTLAFSAIAMLIEHIFKD